MIPSSSENGLPSERSFGIFFAVVFVLLAAYAVYADWRSFVVIGFLIVAVIFGIAAFFIPKILIPLNRFWFALGILLGRIVSPIVLGIIFFGLITPIGMITRLFGRDELRLCKRTVSTYWIERNPAGPEPESFKNQY